MRNSDWVCALNLSVGGQAYKLIMEYVPLGSLKDYLPRHKKDTSLATLLSYSVQICKVRIVYFLECYRVVIIRHYKFCQDQATKVLEPEKKNAQAYTPSGFEYMCV